MCWDYIKGPRTPRPWAGTGSGMGSFLLEAINDRYPKKLIQSPGLFDSLQSESGLVLGSHGQASRPWKEASSIARVLPVVAWKRMLEPCQSQSGVKLNDVAIHCCHDLSRVLVLSFAPELASRGHIRHLARTQHQGPVA